MICAKCHSDNLADAVFCAECGARMEQACSACGTTNERLRAELALRSIESTVAFVLYGASSLERERAIRRMCELGERIGEVDQLLRGLIALCNLYFVSGEPVRGLELARRCFRTRREHA